MTHRARAHAAVRPATSRAALSAGIAHQLHRALNQALASLADEAAAAPALLVPRAPSAIAPARLAATHPGSTRDREQVQALYERCLAQYRRLIAPEAAIAFDDVGAALAHFVAANLEALGGAPAAPATLVRLERQLAAVVRASSDWNGAGPAERQAYFERVAILAVLVAESSAQAAWQGPAAVANVQRAARGYLEQLIGVDADALTLAPEGLTLRGFDGRRAA